MSNVIYEPAGKAREYCELALNIYSGCTNGCFYCYAPRVLHKTKEIFHRAALLRPEVTPEKVVQEIQGRHLEGRTIQLCFTCDPYPSDSDTAPTRGIIQAIKQAGAYVQVLTKNGISASRDFDLLDSHDSFGVTLTAFSNEDCAVWEPKAELPAQRLNSLIIAKNRSIRTWVSFEPVIFASDTLALLNLICDIGVDMVKIGKMNYCETPEPINWAAFGCMAERICQSDGQPYYIKDGLRAEMERGKA